MLLTLIQEAATAAAVDLSAIGIGMAAIAAAITAIGAGLGHGGEDQGEIRGRRARVP